MKKYEIYELFSKFFLWEKSKTPEGKIAYKLFPKHKLGHNNFAKENTNHMMQENSEIKTAIRESFWDSKIQVWNSAGSLILEDAMRGDCFVLFEEDLKKHDLTYLMKQNLKLVDEKQMNEVTKKIQKAFTDIKVESDKNYE